MYFIIFSLQSSVNYYSLHNILFKYLNIMFKYKWYFIIVILISDISDNLKIKFKNYNIRNMWNYNKSKY